MSAPSADVGADLGQRLAGVGGVLLVALAVAAVGDLHVDRVAERAVERGGVLGGVGQDGDVAVAGVVEGGADGRHLAVHHPARAPRRRRRLRPGPPRPGRRGRGWRRCRPRPRPSSTPQWPWSVYSSTQRSAMSTSSSPTSSRRSRRAPPARCRRGPRRPNPRRPWWPARRRGSRRARRGRPARRPPCGATRVCWTTPGSDAIGWGSSMPSRTNSGATRSSTDSRVSATRRAAPGCGAAGAAGAGEGHGVRLPVAPGVVGAVRP